MRKRALIFGCTGQDGKYLAELLLQKGYEVHGTKRRSSSYNTERLNHIYQDPHEKNINFILHYADVTDSTNVLSVIQKVQPDEIYNLAAQSHVKVSFETPEYTANADALGPLRILEAIRILGLQTRFYQASTSEMFGGLSTEPYNEQSPFDPRSPYAAAKLYAHNITVNYREAYGIWACCGILFNHESPYRGETFVTRKITMGIPEVMDGGKIYLGNIDAMRDWGHAQDYMEAAWMMLQQDQPNDYVIATGQTYSVRHFAKLAFEYAGMELEFLHPVSGSGVVGVIDKKRIVIEIDPKYYRPTEVNYLRGDYSKAYLHLGWKPKHTLIDIIKEMVEYDLQNANRFKDIRSRA